MIEKKKFRAVSLDKLDNETIMRIREWRNQDFVREMMFNKHIISEEEHINYIEKVKKDPNRNIFVFYLDGEPFEVFQYEIDEKDNMAHIGNYLIDAVYQDMGYGAIGEYMIDVILYEWLKVEGIRYEILSNNIIQLKCVKDEPIAVENYEDPETGESVDSYIYESCKNEKIGSSKYEKVIYRFVEKEDLSAMILS